MHIVESGQAMMKREGIAAQFLKRFVKKLGLLFYTILLQEKKVLFYYFERFDKKSLIFKW